MSEDAHPTFYRLILLCAIYSEGEAPTDAGAGAYEHSWSIVAELWGYTM